MKNNKNDLKYNDCVRILSEIHDILAIALSSMTELEADTSTALELIKKTLEGIETISKMSDKEIEQLNRDLGLIDNKNNSSNNTKKELDNNLSLQYNRHIVDKNDVIVVISENVTKGIIQ